MPIINYYIVPKTLHDTTDWVAKPGIEVGPVQICSGKYAGSYAVNTAIFGSDPCFEKYRSLFANCEQSSLNNGQDLIVDEIYE